MALTTVLVVDDHPLFSTGLANLIDAQPQYRVVGEARSAAEAVEIQRVSRPMFAIVDLNLGDEDGLELIRQLLSRDPDLLVLVLSMHDERFYAERALSAGAKGYIMKEEVGSQVLDAVKTILSGQIWLSESERQRIRDYEEEEGLCHGEDWYASVDKLSDRQLHIFSLIGKGLGTLEIAARLDLSTKTIDTHKEHIKQKLHCHSTQELRQLAIEWANR
jgi:two-component system response regulator NreC